MKKTLILITVEFAAYHVSLNVKKHWESEGNKSLLCLIRKVVNFSSLEVFKAIWSFE